MRSVSSDVDRTGPLSGAFSSEDWLALAASPTFAIMALLARIAEGGPADVLCSISSGSPLSGMPAMYLLMSAFHLTPWLKLLGRAPTV